MIDSPVRQLEAATTRAGLIAMFRPLTFDIGDVESLESCGEGDDCEVGFLGEDLPLGVLYVEVHDSGNPEDEGLTLGLRGWRLDDGVASV